MSVLNGSGFSVAYYLFTFFAIEASFVVAVGHWRRSLSLKARRFAVAFGALGVFRVLGLLAVAGQSVAVKTSLEQALGVISLGVLAWSFSPYLNHRTTLATAFVAANTLLAAGVFVVGAVMAADSPATIWLVWQIGLGVLLLASQLYRFSPDQIFTATGVVVLIAGAVLQLAWGDSRFPGVEAPVFSRLSELIAYPMLVIAVYQEVIESLNVQSRALKSLSETSQEQIQGLISLFEATKDIVSSLDLSEVLDGAAEGVVQALNVDQCAIALPEEGEPTLLRMVATFNPYRKGRGEAITFPLSEQQAIKHAIERQRQVEINRAFDSPQIKFLFAMMGATDKTGPLVLQPLVLKSETIGVLIVGNAHSKRLLGPTERQLIKTMANQIAVAIDNARAHHSMITRSQQLAWTLRNNEQDARRRQAAMEAELKKSREEVTIISQQLYEQETLARKSQKEITDYQQHINQLSRRLKIAHQQTESLTHDNRQLSVLSESRKKQLEELQLAEEELNTLRGKLQELEFEASEARKLDQSLKAAQERSRKLAKALRRSRARVQEMASMPPAITGSQGGAELENLSCGVLISSPEGNISRVNTATTRLLQRDSSQLVGQKLADVISDEAWQKALQKIAVEKETLVSATLTVGGQTIKATLSPISGPDNGQLNGSVVLLYDATDEIEHQQARDEFVASLAQELRTPMTSITGYVDLLLGESVGMIGDLQRKFLQRVKANVERMDSLLSDLIGIAAIDAGQLDINPAPIHMAELIEDAIIGAKAQLEEKEIQLSLDLPDQNPTVQADPASMQQVMANLLGNATKCTPVNGVVEVKAVIISGPDFTAATSTLDESVDEKWLRVSITDSGGGIAEKDIDRVFERFYKADHPLVQGLGETGVGLSIVKYLIEAHDGEVWFDTEMGKGTTFHFALPISDFFTDPWQEVDVPPLDLNSDIPES